VLEVQLRCQQKALLNSFNQKDLIHASEGPLFSCEHSGSGIEQLCYHSARAMKLTENTEYQAFLTPDAFILYPSRVKLVLMALVCLVFAAGTILVWDEGGTDDRIIAIVAWIFLGLAFSFFITRLAKHAPSLIVNRSGIFDNSSALGPYMLHWEEIESVYVSSTGRQKFLSLQLRDPEGFLNRQSGVKVRLMRANMKMAGSPVSISANTLPIKLEELKYMIRQKCPALRVE